MLNRGPKSIFPQKLWRMVNDSELDSAIKWNQDGKSFTLYENPLKNMCLGKENKMFYTNQPKSFIRQLHLYGFRKISKNQFAHPFFQRDQPELLENIRRTYNKQHQNSNNWTNSSNLENSPPQEVPPASSDEASAIEAPPLPPPPPPLPLEAPGGAIAFENNYEESPMAWYDGNVYADMNYNYHDSWLLLDGL